MPACMAVACELCVCPSLVWLSRLRWDTRPSPNSRDLIPNVGMRFLLPV